jgi:uncharacterized LabA/DUF88 family protein
VKDNYFFVDGSALINDVKRLHDAKPDWVGVKLNLNGLALAFVNETQKYTARSWRRFTYYFAVGDTRVEQLLLLPSFETPGVVEDVAVRFCGKRLDTKLREADAWLQERQAPQWVTDRLGRTEKAVDTQICCEALQLAAVRKIDRLFLYTNDYDFVPLCRTLRSLGVNVNLIRLVSTNVNQDLVCEVDGFNVIHDSQLAAFFGQPTSA